MSVDLTCGDTGWPQYTPAGHPASFSAREPLADRVSSRMDRNVHLHAALRSHTREYYLLESHRLHFYAFSSGSQNYLLLSVIRLVIQFNQSQMSFFTSSSTNTSIGALQ